MEGENMKEKRKKKTIYDLRLHESVYIASINSKVMRVPGGWIYELPSINHQVVRTFVPMPRS